MARKIVNNSDAGVATKHGGDDIDYINKYLTGVDQTATDPVTINTKTNFRDQKFMLRNPANTFSYIFQTQPITADRIITLPYLTNDDGLVCQDFEQPLTNKDLRAHLQKNVASFLTNPLVKRWGSYQVSSGGILSDGLLANTFVYGTATTAASMDPSYGYYQDYQTAGSTNDKAGIQPAPVLAVETMRRWNPNMSARFLTPYTTTQRLMIGFTSNTTIPTSDAILSNTDEGIMFGFRSTDANYQIFHNNGGGAMTVVNTGIAIDTAVHSVEFRVSDTGPNCVIVFDGVGIATITTALPASTTPLAFFAILEQTTAAARNLRLYDIFYEDKKA